MLKNEKILITGITSSVSRYIADSLTANNEVWGVARFKDEKARAQLDAAGIKTVALDVGSGDFAELPADFTYVLHLAYFRSSEPDFEEVYRVNGEGTGLILSHCRKAKAALYMSSHVVYAPREDPWYAQRETDPVGTGSPGFSATSGVSKLIGEAVARYCAREFNLPVMIARLNAPYAAMDWLLPTIHMDMVMAGKEIGLRWDPMPYNPIHLDDMCDQLEPLLDAAAVPGTIVNWAGDETITSHEWCNYTAEWGGKTVKYNVQPVPGSQRGVAADTTKRKSITGPCKVPFKEGFRRAFEERYGNK